MKTVSWQRRRQHIGAIVGLLALAACAGGSSLRPLGAAGVSASQQTSPDAFQKNDGSQFVEFTPPCANGQSRLGPISVGADGNLWYVRYPSCIRRYFERGSVGVVNILTNTTTEYLLPERLAYPGPIAQNAGYIWIAGLNLNPGRVPRANARSIYRVDTSGNISTFGVPGGDMLVRQMTQGPDGNLWAAGGYDRHGSHPGYGYISPTGQTVAYVLHRPKYNRAVPNSIVTGPDGNLWMTTEDYGAVLRIAPADGSITSFAVGGYPDWITAAHHFLVYTDRTFAQISVMDVKGKVTIYPAPSGEHPGFITTKPDGTVYFIDQTSGGIASFDPTNGTYGSLLSPPSGGVAYLANASDGNLWFENGLQLGAYLKFVLVTSPAALSWYGSNCAAQTFAASETNYNGSFTATSGNAQIVTVTQTGNATFSVTPVGTGTATVGVYDQMGNAVNVAANVQAGCSR